MTVQVEPSLYVRDRPRHIRFMRDILASKSGMVGLVILSLILGVAIFGPVFAPFSPNAIVGVPFIDPTTQHILGTDVLGRDVLSRFLNGGRTLIIAAFLATILASFLGVAIGMAVGFRKGSIDFLTIAVMDLMLSVPSVILVLILLAAKGTRVSIAIIGIAIVHLPRIVRLVRSVTLEITAAEFIEAAIVRGETTFSVLYREMLPNLRDLLIADFGFRITASIILFSSMAYLGLGTVPPAADWGLMISENRIGITIQPWVVFVPAVAIGLFAVGANLVTDAVARSLGGSVVSRAA